MDGSGGVIANINRRKKVWQFIYFVLSRNKRRDNTKLKNNLETVIFNSESKVLQYFNNVRHNSAAPDTFAVVVKVTNHTGLWDAELVSYSPSAPSLICLYKLEHDVGIHGFRPTLPCLIVESLATGEKFLEPFGYCTVTIFHTINVFGCFGGVMALFELVKHKFPN